MSAGARPKARTRSRRRPRVGWARWAEDEDQAGLVRGGKDQLREEKEEAARGAGRVRGGEDQVREEEDAREPGQAGRG